MRMLSLCILAFVLAAGTIANAQEVEDWTRDLKTYQGTLGSEPVILELAFPRGKDEIVGRYTFPKIGKDIPLHSASPVDMRKGAGGKKTFVEEAPCSPKTCQSIVPERDDEAMAFAPGGAPKAAQWLLSINKDGTSISGTRKDLQTGESKTVSLTFARMISITDDCCNTYELLGSGNNAFEDQRELSYDALKNKITFKSGPKETMGEVTYHIETDDRIGSDFPVIDSLPGNTDITKINDWLHNARIELYRDDFECRSRAYHGFRWNKAMAEKLENYKTESTATIDFLSGKLMGLTNVKNVRCGNTFDYQQSEYLLVDTKTGKPVNAKTLLAGFKYFPTKDINGNPMSDGQFLPNQELIKKISTAIADEGGDDSCLDAENQKVLTAAFRGDNMAFTFEKTYVSAECDIDILTIPLAEAGEYLSDQGKAYFSEFLK